MGIMYFQNGEFDESRKILESTLQNLKDEANYEELKKILLVKLYANLIIIYIVTTNYQKSQDTTKELIAMISKCQGKKRTSLFKELVYMFFRFTSFNTMTDEFIDEFAQEAHGAPKASFYSSVGLYRELINKRESAYKYHKKALELWHECREPVFMLLSLKHMAHLSKDASVSEDEAKGNDILFTSLLKNECKDIDPKRFFEEFERKLCAAGEIASQLKVSEDNFNNKIHEGSQKSIEKDKKSQKQFPFWKQAIKLRLLKTIKMSEKHIGQEGNIKTGRKVMKKEIEHMKFTLDLLEGNNDPIIEENLENLKYSKDAVNQLKAAINIIQKKILKIAEQFAFAKLENNPRKPKKLVSVMKSTPLADKFVQKGGYLIKCHRDSNGRVIRFFKLLPNGNFRWASKESNINRPYKYFEYNVQNMNGICYGKVTETLLKKFNKTLNRSMCFSLFLKHRTLDLCCKDSTIDYWIIALGAEIKKRNPKAFALSYGKYLWRKLTLKILEKFLIRADPKKKKKPPMISYYKK